MQFGFRDSLRIREALFSLNIRTQRCLNVNQDVHVCFVDSNKAFDMVRHDQLIQLLYNKGIDINTIANHYYGQRAGIRLEEKTIEEIKILRGGREIYALADFV